MDTEPVSDRRKRDTGAMREQVLVGLSAATLALGLFAWLAPSVHQFFAYPITTDSRLSALESNSFDCAKRLEDIRARVEQLHSGFAVVHSRLDELCRRTGILENATGGRQP